MKKKLFSTVLTLIVMVLSLWGCSMLGMAGKKVPKTGPEIMDRYVEAIGGVKAFDKINNRHVKALMTMENMGISMDIEIFAEKPNKFYTTAVSEQIGEIEKGTDGTVYWEKSMMQGPRILEGEELEQARQEYQFDKFAHWRKYYKDVEFVGIDSVRGEPCYKIMLTPLTGKLQEVYFNQQTCLMMELKFEMEHQMGVIPVQTYMQDYREVDGIKMPFETIVTVMGQDRKVSISGVEHNIEMPADRFTLPEDIKALQEKD